MNQLIHMLEERMSKKAKFRYIPFNKADVLANVADVTKARQILGWQPQITMAEGLTRLVDWYLAERSWAKDINTD